MLEFERFELPDQNYLLSNLVLLITTGRLPLNSLAFNVLCSNVRGLCMTSDFTGTGFRWNGKRGRIQCEREELRELEKTRGEKLYCCVECKEKDLKVREKVEEVRTQKCYVEFDEHTIPITALEGLYFQPHGQNEQMFRALTAQTQFNRKPINFFELQGALQQTAGSRGLVFGFGRPRTPLFDLC